MREWISKKTGVSIHGQDKIKLKNFLKDYCWDNVGAGAGGACTGTGAGAGAAGTAGADGRAAPTATLTPGAGAGAGAAGAAVQPVGHTGYYCVTCNTTITFEEANKNEKNCTCNEGYLPIGERTCKSVDDLGAGAGTAGTAGAAAGTAGAGADADAHALFACEQIGELIGAKSGVNEAKCIEMEARFKFLLSLRPGSEVNDEVSVCLYIIYIYIILCIYILC